MNQKKSKKQSDLPDISIIGNVALNKSLLESINYAERHNLVIEICKDGDSPRADLVCEITNSDIYYNDYYLHYQWVCLAVKNTKVRNFKLINMIVYDQEAEVFYVTDAINNFYRRNRKSGSFIEESAFLSCSTNNLLVCNKNALPDNKALLIYRNLV